MIPLSDGIRLGAFPSSRLADRFANFAVWIFLTSSATPRGGSSFHERLFSRARSWCLPTSPLPWGVAWITSMFMHGSWSHILCNMLFLASFGERREEDAVRPACSTTSALLAGGFIATMTHRS